MSQKGIVQVVLLLVLVAALAVCVARATASWNTGSQVGASWVSGMVEATD